MLIITLYNRNSETHTYKNSNLDEAIDFHHWRYLGNFLNERSGSPCMAQKPR